MGARPVYIGIVAVNAMSYLRPDRGPAEGFANAVGGVMSRPGRTGPGTRWPADEAHETRGGGAISGSPGFVPVTSTPLQNAT